MQNTNPANHEAAVRLAHAMYEHVASAGQEGMPLADAAAAVAMAAGMLLSGAYRPGASRDITARKMAQAAVQYASQFDGMARQGPART